MRNALQAKLRQARAHGQTFSLFEYSCYTIDLDEYWLLHDSQCWFFTSDIDFCYN